jgi:hypothetical protein
MITPEAIDKPGLYYEEEVLQADTARVAGKVAITAGRRGGQWEARIYPASGIISSGIPDDAPLLGSIVTDVDGMSEDPHNNRGNRLPREQVWPIAATWFVDRGLEGQFDSAISLRGGIYENEAYMGAVLDVQAHE